MASLTVGAQSVEKKIVELENKTIPFFNGLAVSADLVGVAQMAFGDYGQYEAALRVNLKNKYFPVFELGYGKENACFPIDVTPLRSILARDPQPLKALVPRVSAPPRSTCSRDEQPKNAYAPTEAAPSRVTDVRFRQPWKALRPTSTSEVTETMEPFLRKALGAMDVTSQPNPR